MDPITDWTAEWLDPEKHPPPLNRKILLLTDLGTAVIGAWGEGFIAWSPLPKIPSSIKRKIGRVEFTHHAQSGPAKVTIWRT